MPLAIFKMLYIDKHPYKSKRDLFANNVSILLLKNLRLNKDMSPVEAVEFFLGWFSDVKQPTERKVRDAIILQITDSDREYKYSIKQCGESMSDNSFHSSVECLVMDGKGYDKMVTFYAKYSNNFEDVLITREEIFDAILNNLDVKETRKVQINKILELPRAYMNTVFKNPDFTLPEYFIYEIFRYEDIFLNKIESIQKSIEEDLIDFQSISNYKKKYIVFEDTDIQLLENKITHITNLSTKKLNILKKLRAEYETKKCVSTIVGG